MTGVFSVSFHWGCDLLSAQMKMEGISVVLLCVWVVSGMAP